MKTSYFMQNRVCNRPSRALSAFTLPEVMIAAALFVLLVGGIITANLFGMRLFQIAENKLKATDSVRKALGVMADEIRQSRSVWVGNVTNGSFVAQVEGESQVGNALLVQPSTTTNVIVYFLNTGDNTLRRAVGASSSATILATSVTNTAIFSAQDCFGNVLTNGQSDRVVHATLSLVQPQPWLPAGEYSKLETSVTRRLTD